MTFSKGFVQVFTGDGKGKTTSAIGLAIRAMGSDHTVFFAQFVKSKTASEFNALSKMGPSFTFVSYGASDSKFLFERAPTEEDKIMARGGLSEAHQAMFSKNYDMVILDEVNIAVYYNLIEVKELLELIHQKPDSVELVLTGRYADPRIIEAADLVTEMKNIKHPFDKGIKARRGIEF